MKRSIVLQKQWRYGLLFLLAAGSFFTTLFLPYMGEEGVYTLTSLEMFQDESWMVPTLYGHNYGRPPLYNWLIIPIASFLGWSQVLVAARLVTALSTILTSILLLFFVRHIFKNTTLALLSGLIYLSGDLLIQRGWIAYADPLFSFFVFGSMIGLWVALEKKEYKWLVIALVSLTGAFLTKAITCYAFYGVTFLILYYKKPEKRFLISPGSLLLHGAAIIFPLVWQYFITRGAHGESMLGDVLGKFTIQDILHYLKKLVIYPFDTAFRFLPASGVLFYFWLKGYRTSAGKNNGLKSHLSMHSAIIQTIFWIVLLNYIPYWVAPETRLRYFLPLYPFIALLIAYFILVQGKYAAEVTIKWLFAFILIKYFAGMVFFPRYEAKFRGDYMAAAKEIIQHVSENGNYPLYTADSSSTGLSVTAQVNVVRWPAHTLVSVSPVWDHAFVIGRKKDFPEAQVVKTYQFAGQTLHLLCRGLACQGPKP